MPNNQESPTTLATKDKDQKSPPEPKEEVKVAEKGKLTRQSKTQAILANKVLINKEKSFEENENSKSKGQQKVSITQSGRASKKPRKSNEFIEDFRDKDEEDEYGEEDEDDDDESSYSEKDAINDEYRIRQDGSHDSDCFNYDQIKKGLLKAPGAEDISQGFTKINKYQEQIAEPKGQRALTPQP